MVEWPTSKLVRSLRGFLGLTGYRKKYVANYGAICRPLIDLLKKDSFKWSEEAYHVFAVLKTTMTNTFVLALSDYSK